MHSDLQQIGLTNELVAEIARKMVGYAKVPEFSLEKIPTKVAAKVYGKSETWVRTGILEGWLPIGHATKSPNRTSPYISPKGLWEDTGFIWRGMKHFEASMECN